MAAKPLLPIKIEGVAEHKLEEILRSGYRLSFFHYLVKWKGCLANEAIWLLESRWEHAKDLVRRFHEAHPMLLKPLRWGLRS
jgi:hypothetical protein